MEAVKIKANKTETFRGLHVAFIRRESLKQFYNLMKN